MSMTDALYRLQELDQAEEKLKKKQRELEDDPDYAEARQELKAWTQQLETDRRRLTEIVKDQHRQELDLKQAVSKREEIRGRMYDGSVNNMKELEKMTHMVEDLEAAGSRLEDSILNLMGEAEELEDNIREKNIRMEEMSVRLQEMETERAVAAENLEKERAGLPSERERLVADIPVDLVSRYQSARSRMGGGQPLARADKAVCTGCRMAISATVMREIKKGERLVQCESCGRILHLEKQ